MRTVTTSRLDLPAVGFGTWQLEGDDAYTGVRHALEVGYRHVDTAQIYRNEDVVGRAVADSEVAREDVFLVTKIWRADAGRDALPGSAEASLRRLGTDHVDLLLLHWPSEEVAPLEETLEALTAVRDRGLTRHIGVSNFPAALLRRAADLAPIVTDQVEHHPYLAVPAIEAVAADLDLVVSAYSPIAQGEVLHDPVLQEIAAGHGATPAQVALAWLLRERATVVLPRSRTPARIEENLAAQELELSADEIARIAGLARGERLIDPPFAPAWDAA